MTTEGTDEDPLSDVHCISLSLSLSHARARTENRTKNSQQKLKWQIDGEGGGREGSGGNILEERRCIHPPAVRSRRTRLQGARSFLSSSTAGNLFALPPPLSVLGRILHAGISRVKFPQPESLGASKIHICCPRTNGSS